MKFVAAAVAITIAAPAWAQQTPTQSVQDQLVSVYVNLNTGLAKQLDAANAQIADLQAELDTMKEEIEALAKSQ